MNVNEYGQVLFDVKEAIDYLYSGVEFNSAVSDQNEIAKHQQFAHHFDLHIIKDIQTPSDDALSHHQKLSNNWNMPIEYQQMDVERFLSEKLNDLGLTSDAYIQTLVEEIQEYQQRNMINLCKFLIYLMDTCQQNDIVTGVGRGSSVASLVLYLIGVHHIDPIKYNLDYKEFLR